jgi:ribonucleoside-diphosphate reductase alpha chain
MSKITWERRDARITNVAGDVFFEQKDVEVPKFWSQTALNVTAQKYLRGGPVGHPGRETSIRDMINRAARTIAQWGLEDGYLDAAEVFARDLFHLVARQEMAFNSPVWFNVGVKESPQASACFLLSVEDSMESIMDLAKTEVMLFRHGSGCGTNLSGLRSSAEGISGGGLSSGPVAFMAGFDSFAGVTKSGGTTRRAAKMVILNVDHPDVDDFIRCKMVEERKAAALVAAGWSGAFDAPMLDGAYGSVQYQNANHSVRVTDAFMKAAQKDEMWPLRAVTDGRVIREVSARELMRKISEATHACGDPGMQYHDTINRWHTSKTSGPIRTSNPCQPANATVLTRGGIRTFADVDVGSEIWSGQQWTNVRRKVATGVKPVYRYVTRAGVFLGTENHRVISGGERVEVQDVDTIDTSVGPRRQFVKGFHRHAVVDGLVLGDGSGRMSGGNYYPILYVGQDDQEYFSSEVAEFINSTPFDGCAHRVSTSLQPHELPPTYERRVPDRHMRGSPISVRSFLRGLYSANGSICGNRVTLKSASLGLIEDVQQMMSALGIRSYYTVNKTQRIKFANGEYDCKESYDLNVTTDRALFAELIGFIHQYKNEKLSEVVLNTATRHWSKESYEVVSVEFVGHEPVWDIEVEADEHTYWTGGLLVSNCSEFMYLDDTACNLAALNVKKFDDPETGVFDVKRFRRAVRTTILAQEIVVGRAGYPTEKIAENSRRFRPLGIGHTNVGGLLMARGIPYDSDEARSIAASITALMTGTAYERSADIANIVGPCDGYEENRQPFLEVIREHARHAEEIANVHGACPIDGLAEAAAASWRDAWAAGCAHGFRNGQVSVEQPCGTVGLMLDSDTTGIEPELALVKYKQLVGGGTIKTANGLVGEALRTLGYDERARDEIVRHVYTTGTIEGSKLRVEHLPVFDCALAPSGGGRTISWRGHVGMMAAIQPFLSGAISKTVNVPHETSVEEIQEIYETAWVEGLKSIAIYRDGCKSTQPLATVDQSAGAEVTTRARGSGPPTSARVKLAVERSSITHRFSVGSHKGYVTVGMYDDGSPGEIFVRMAKEGSTVAGLMDSFATAVSLALQHGTPLVDLIDKFKGSRFEPAGFTDHNEIKIATSIVDYLFRWLEIKFTTSAQAQRTVDLDVTLQGSAAAKSHAPTCRGCGTLMERSGTCHRCPTCGETSGCS